jgi:hypothetical protein
LQWRAFAQGYLEEMYGKTDHLPVEPLVIDRPKMKELGLMPGKLATGDGTIRYVVGCIKRERERLARVFVNEKGPEKIAEAILDASLDDKVFKWIGPSATLDASPTPIQNEQIPEQKPPMSS